MRQTCQLSLVSVMKHSLLNLRYQELQDTEKFFEGLIESKLELLAYDEIYN